MNIFGNVDFFIDYHQRIAHIKLIIFDFDGVFTDNSVFVQESGIECVRCY